MLRIGEGRTDAAQFSMLVPVVENHLYSGYHCRGSSEKRYCVFENICWYAGLSAFLYFAEPENEDVAAEDLAVRYGANYSPFKTVLPLRVEKGASFSEFAEGKPVVAHIVVPFLPPSSGPFDVGHYLADELLPIFSIAVDSGVDPNSLQLIAAHGCKEYPCENCRPGHGQLCRRIFQRYTSLLTDQDVRFLSAMDTTCFRTVLAGHGSRASVARFQGILRRPPSKYFPLFREHVYKRLKIENNSDANEKPVIAVRTTSQGLSENDTSRHHFTNYEEVASCLHNRYGDSGYKVVLFDSTQFVTLKDEVQFLSEVVLLVTPAGGETYTAMFMRDESVLATGAVCLPGHQSIVTCGPQDACWWYNAGYIRHIVYNQRGPHSIDSVVGEGGMSTNAAYGGYRGYDVTCSELLRLVEPAMEGSTATLMKLTWEECRG